MSSSSRASAKPIQSQGQGQGQNSDQDQELPVVGLQPLFDSSISLSYDGANNRGSNNNNNNNNIVGGSGTSKADSARVLTPPSSSTFSAADPNSNVFGMLPVAGGPRMSIDNALGSHMQQSQQQQQQQQHHHSGAASRHRTNSVVANSSHGRTASYGTSLLDTLNEEKQQQQQQQQQSMGQGLQHHHHSQYSHHQARLGHNRSATAAGTDIIGGVLGSGHQHHQRHFTLGSPSPFSLLTQSDSLTTAKPSSSMSPPNATAAIGLALGNSSNNNNNPISSKRSSSSSSNGNNNDNSGGSSRMAAHMRSHTLTASPPGSGLLKQPLPTTNASGMLGAHARLGSLSGISAALQSSSSSGLVGSSLLSSSALRSSYSSNSLRSAFARRNSPSPSPLGGGVGIGSSADQISVSSPISGATVPAVSVKACDASNDIGSSSRSFGFSSSLNDGVWGPSGLSTELDILATPDGSASASSNINANHMGLADAMNSLTVESALGHMGITGADAASRGHSRNGSIVAGNVSADAYARIRSYSFNSPPEGIEGPDEPDIDVLHAAAKAQNPSLAFRKLMARTHARSKTMSNPFETAGDYAQQQQPYHHQTHMRKRMSTAGLDHLHGSSLVSAAAQHGSGHSRQQSEGEIGGATVHLGIGGETVLPATFSSTSIGAANPSVTLSAASASSMLQQQQQQQRSAQAATGSAPSSSSANSALLGATAHSRQPSMHTRQHSVELDYISAMHAAAAAASGGSGSGDGVPTRSLWVGNVDPSLSSQDLVAIFGKYGRVESLRLLPDKECAFVNFMRLEDAIHAKKDMYAGARIGNNTVRVGYGKGESYAMGDAQAMQPTRALWIGNIAPTITPDALSTVFQAYGTIDSARVLNHKNCGFVNFIRLEDAVRAKQAMNGKSIDGMVVRIGYAKVPAAKNESSVKMRNPVPSAAPLTVPGQIAEADAITGTTQCGLGSDMMLEPGFSLAIDEDLVAFPYATQLPALPEPSVVIRPDPADSSSPTAQQVFSPTPALASSGDDKGRTVLQQSRLREIRKLLETPSGSSPISQAEFDQIVAELMPHAVDLCTDYVGNVLVQKIAERGSAEQKLELVHRVAPHMTAIGAHKNGTWAVQRIIDTADTAEQRKAIVDSIRPFTPQLLLDQLGNYVVQCCLRFGAPTDDGANEVAASNQFAYDAIHARCLEIAQGRFGARAIRTCLDSAHVSKLQQKLVAVSLVTNAVSLATNANGHLLMNWLLDSSKFSGRFRVLAHQLAPHLRYLATHKLGASTISKLVDQSSEPDARDLILNTLFFNPDPTVLDDVLLDQAQGIHVVLKILQGSSIGDAEKARIADRLRFVTLDQQQQSYFSAKGASSSATSSSAANHHHNKLHRGSPGGSPAGSRSGSASASSNVAPAQRLAETVSAILAHSQPVYPT
ncbi:hypothetical protein J3B02_002429, partial [Coemansia erecta]